MRVVVVLGGSERERNEVRRKSRKLLMHQQEALNVSIL